MAELESRVVIDLAGNLQQQARRYEQSLNNFAKRGETHLQRFTRVASVAGRGLDRLGNRWTAIATGAVGVGAAREVISLGERFARLGIAADKSEEEINKLKKQIFEVSQQPDIRIDPGQLIAAVEEIVEKTGDLDFARENLDSLALAIGATGAEGAAIGGIGAEFQKMGIEVEDALAILITQGKEGAFTLQNLASLGPRVVTAYTAMGRTGVPAIREMGAALQVIRMGTGSSDQAATAFEALLRVLGDADKVKLFEGSGIQVYENVERTILRPINQLMVDIVKAVDGSKLRLSPAVDSEAMRAFNAAISEYLANHEVESLERFYNVQADGNLVTRDAARVANTSAGAIRYLRTAWLQFSDENLSEPIEQLADYLNSLDPKQVREYFDTAATGVKILVGAIVANKLIGLVGGVVSGIRFLRGGGGRKGGRAGELGGGLAGMAGSVAPIPVWVMNPGFGGGKGMGGFGGGVGGGRGGRGGGRAGGGVRGRTARTFSRAATGRALLGSRLATVGTLGAGAMGLAGAGVVAAGAAGYGVGTVLNKTLIEGTKFGDAIGEGVARTLALFGNDEARAAVAAQEKYGTSTLGEGVARLLALLGNDTAQAALAAHEGGAGQAQPAKLQLEITGDAADRVRVRNASDADVEVSGPVGGYN